MSNYTPKSEETLAKEGLFPPGTYDVEVAEVSDKPSKAGNPMIMLKLNVFDSEGNVRGVFDYIVPSSNFGERKLRHAANAFGLLDKYESGEVWAEDFLNQVGRAEIGHSKSTPDYPMPKNIVVDYIGRDEASVATAQKKAAPKAKDDLDDSIPF